MKPIQPEGWAPPKGYANGMLAPDGTLHVAGQIGWDADQVFRAEGFVAQFERALANVLAVVEAAGGGAEHVGRLTWFVTDKAAYLAAQREVGAAWRRVMGRHYPAMSVVEVTSLMEPAALVEIEATAHIPPG